MKIKIFFYSSSNSLCFLTIVLSFHENCLSGASEISLSRPKLLHTNKCEGFAACVNLLTKHFSVAFSSESEVNPSIYKMH